MHVPYCEIFVVLLLICFLNLSLVVYTFFIVLCV